ncbi:MAG: hypothetical protein MJ071_08670 [Oscillospiraceae bacterium]|nr:hypothetical protein [Oscillospiraceae bacterium]
MKNYAARLKRRNLIDGIFAAAALTAMVVFRITMKEAESFNMLQGFCTGFAVVLIIRIIRNAQCLHNEELLRKKYIASTDERTLAIEREVSTTTLRISMLVLGITTVITSFVSESTAYTLAAVLGIITLLQFILYAVYNRRM